MSENEPFQGGSDSRGHYLSFIKFLSRIRQQIVQNSLNEKIMSISVKVRIKDNDE